MASPSIDADILQAWRLSPQRYLGGGHNQHWLVEAPAGAELVLRRYMKNHFEDLAYEFEVMRRLRGLGWPVPEMLEERVDRAGDTWCLLTRLPGDHSTETGKGEQRRRGRLLAELHLVTKELADLGQRQGFLLPDEMVSDPALHAAIKAYEVLRPDAGYVLRWHLERAADRLAALDVAKAERLILHSDFVARNLLFDDERLCGVLDFEATHLNVRVADFALSWRGCYDEVVHGYEEVHPLDDLDWHMLVPTFWAWLFIGLKSQIEGMDSADLQRADFSWQIKQMLRRSPLFGDLREPFRR